MHRLIYLIFLQLIAYQSFGQEKNSYLPPLKMDLALSANFGELREDHFHSGIDFRTNGTTGHPLYSVMDGYVSRIKIQTNGYGKSIYIAHPDGTTSVYGHLEHYRDDIEDYVKKIQYQRRSHQVDIYTGPDLFRIKEGELIAFSGNTGGSFGPHLHFELRNSASQHPLNVLRYGFGIADHTPPRFETLFVYSGEKRSYSLVKDQGKYTVPWGTRVTAGEKFALGVEVFDYFDGAYNRCGIYRLQLFAGGALVYEFVMDEFSFSESRYVNAHLDYAESQATGKKVHRLYRLPNDRLSIYTRLENDGYLTLGAGESLPVRVVAYDVAGNTSELIFNITGSGGPGISADTSEMRQFMRWGQENIFEEDGVRVQIPANALYEDIGFRYSVSEPLPGSLTGTYHIHDAGTPVHLPYELEVRAPDVDPGLQGKLVFFSIDKDEGAVVSEGGNYSGGMLIASMRHFGEFGIAPDTIPPSIEPKEGSDDKDLRGRKRIEFTVLDELSGVDTYEGYIDNHWALFEYDPKNDLISYEFDRQRITPSENHELELYVTDARGNVNLYHCSFLW